MLISSPVGNVVKWRPDILPLFLSWLQHSVVAVLLFLKEIEYDLIWRNKNVLWQHYRNFTKGSASFASV